MRQKIICKEKMSKTTDAEGGLDRFACCGRFFSPAVTTEICFDTDSEKTIEEWAATGRSTKELSEDLLYGQILSNIKTKRRSSSDITSLSNLVETVDNIEILNLYLQNNVDVDKRYEKKFCFFEKKKQKDEDEVISSKNEYINDEHYKKLEEESVKDDNVVDDKLENVVTTISSSEEDISLKKTLNFARSITFQNEVFNTTKAAPKPMNKPNSPRNKIEVFKWGEREGSNDRRATHALRVFNQLNGGRIAKQPVSKVVAKKEPQGQNLNLLRSKSFSAFSSLVKSKSNRMKRHQSSKIVRVKKKKTKPIIPITGIRFSFHKSSNSVRLNYTRDIFNSEGLDLEDFSYGLIGVATPETSIPPFKFLNGGINNLKEDFRHTWLDVINPLMEFVKLVSRFKLDVLIEEGGIIGKVSLRILAVKDDCIKKYNTGDLVRYSEHSFIGIYALQSSIDRDVLLANGMKASQKFLNDMKSRDIVIIK